MFWTSCGCPQEIANVIKRLLRDLKRRAIRRPTITPGEFPIVTLPSLLGISNPVILDIGCNDGSHTNAFLDLFPEGVVYSFEPDPRAQHAFRRNVTSPRAHLFELAIGAHDGVSDFHVSDGLPPTEAARLRPGGWDLSGSIRKPTGHLEQHPWCSFASVISVVTQRLDTWAASQGITRVDFIWADVQGAEIDLITGGTETLNNTRFLYTEYSERELYEGQVSLRGLVKRLPRFKPVIVYRNDVLFRNSLL